MTELHHLMKTHDLELLDQVLDVWEAIQIVLVDPLTPLYWPADELTLEEPILDLGVEVGRKGVTIPLVVLLFKRLLVFLGSLPIIVPLGTTFQVDWMDPFFLILIIVVIHLEFFK